MTCEWTQATNKPSLVGAPAGNGVACGVGVAVGEGGSVGVGRGESSGESKASGVAEEVADAVGDTEAVAVGEPVGVLLGSGGSPVREGEGEAGSPFIEAPQAERIAVNAAAPAPFRNRRRSRTICRLDMAPL